MCSGNIGSKKGGIIYAHHPHKTLLPHHGAPGSLTADGILGAPADHRERIRSLGVRRIGVFGSFARGEESDIDILIEFREGGRSFDTYMDLKFLLEDRFGRRVDLVNRDAIKPALAPHILRSARYVLGL
jgi:predicted nucleotidyltransferase